MTNWRHAIKKCRTNSIVEQTASSLFEPVSEERERKRKFVSIIVGGDVFKTTRGTLEVFPDTLLGSEGSGMQHWDPHRLAFVFPTRCRLSFDNILFFYQSQGTLKCPPNVGMAIFKKECQAFQLPQVGLG